MRVLNAIADKTVNSNTNPKFIWQTYMENLAVADQTIMAYVKKYLGPLTCMPQCWALKCMRQVHW